jgi:hypothetical protein
MVRRQANGKVRRRSLASYRGDSLHGQQRLPLSIRLHRVHVMGHRSLLRQHNSHIRRPQPVNKRGEEGLRRIR